jgi:F420H(2)-dependent quinone reductase
VTARRVTPEDADYPRLWQLANKNNANRYNGYQRQTSRPIPIFALTAS